MSALGYHAFVVNFERLVPARARVATALTPGTFEYPLFGERLTRILIPVNPFWTASRPIPIDTDFLVFSDALIEPHPGDIYLDEQYGSKYYLRASPATPSTHP